MEFSDFNCPACRSASELAGKIKNIPNLYFEFRHFPLPLRGHESSKIAANAFECAREQNFGDEMETALFADQSRLGEKLFLEIAEQSHFAGNFDAEKFAKCVAEGNFEKLVERDAQAALNFGVNATPTFFVNGVKTPRDELLEAVRQAFEKATR